jgi:hypothetical protein
MSLFWRRMYLPLLCSSSHFWCGEYRRKIFRRMCVKGAHHYDDRFCIFLLNIHEITQNRRPFFLCSTPSEGTTVFPWKRLTCSTYVPYVLSLVFIVFTCRCARFHRDGFLYPIMQRCPCFVQTHLRNRWVREEMRDRENIFHRRDEFLVSFCEHILIAVEVNATCRASGDHPAREVRAEERKGTGDHRRVRQAEAKVLAYGIPGKHCYCTQGALHPGDARHTPQDRINAKNARTERRHRHHPGHEGIGTKSIRTRGRGKEHPHRARTAARTLSLLQASGSGAPGPAGWWSAGPSLACVRRSVGGEMGADLSTHGGIRRRSRLPRA